MTVSVSVTVETQATPSVYWRASTVTMYVPGVVEAATITTKGPELTIVLGPVPAGGWKIEVTPGGAPTTLTLSTKPLELVKVAATFPMAPRATLT